MLSNLIIHYTFVIVIFMTFIIEVLLDLNRGFLNTNRRNIKRKMSDTFSKFTLIKRKMAGVSLNYSLILSNINSCFHALAEYCCKSLPSSLFLISYKIVFLTHQLQILFLLLRRILLLFAISNLLVLLYHRIVLLLILLSDTSRF